MGKNHRHKKKLKSEKAKVHITSKTKFLPKGQNVTDTSFKIKPIILPEQLKEKDQCLLLSKRHSSVPELISKLKHYNDTIKTEACQELRDMIKKHSVEIMQTYLSQIIQTACVLIQDRERKVRRACVSLLSEIFHNVPHTKLETFFNHVLINLKCTMTNIDLNIQEDSLLVLDALLEYQPQLVAKHFETFFSDFLTLISKLKSQATPERTVTLNLGSKLTSVKWRIRVLSRLFGILDAMVKNLENKDESFRNSDVSIVKKASDTFYIPVYGDSNGYEICQANIFGNNSNSRPAMLDEHVASLLPLLYETWLEVIPEKSSKKNISDGSTILSEESAAIFSCVVNILRLLYEYCQIKGTLQVFTSKECVKFMDHLLSNFPYSQSKSKQSEIMKEFFKLFVINNDPNCMEENLIIIHVFITFYSTNIKNTKNKFNFLSTYLTRCLLSHKHISSSNVKYLVKILNEILFVNPKTWRRLGINNNEIMENLLVFYNNGKLTEDSKNMVLEILSYPYTSFTYENHQEWLGQLPRLLCDKQISGKLIDVILNLCKQNHELTHQTVKNHLKEILNNLPVLEITGSTESEIDKANKVVYIFFYLPNLSSDDLKSMYSFVEDNQGLRYAKCMKNMLEIKINLCSK